MGRSLHGGPAKESLMVAQAAGRIEITPGQLRRIEQGELSVRADDRDRLATLYGRPPPWS